MDSCAGPSASPLLRLLASFEESVQVTTRCLSPYAGGLAACFCLVLPQRLRPSPQIDRGGVRTVPREHHFPRIRFRGCSYFFIFRPPRLLAPQDRSHRCKYRCRAADAFARVRGPNRKFRSTPLRPRRVKPHKPRCPLRLEMPRSRGTLERNIF